MVASTDRKTLGIVRLIRCLLSHQHRRGSAANYPIPVRPIVTRATAVGAVLPPW